MSRIAPRVAVITGGSQGLGLGLARALAAHGVAVALAAPDATDIETAAVGLRAEGHAAIGIACDVRDRGAVEQLWREAEARLGPVDAWVSNAGLALTGNSLLDLPAKAFAVMLDTNLLGAFHGCQVAAAGMAERGGAIWNVLGAGADGEPVPRMGGYATSKAALAFFTRSFAAEVAGSSLAIAGLSPGLVLTEGFFREHAKVPPAERAAREAVVNIIADDVPTIAAWAAGLIMAGATNGTIYNWLTAGKIVARKAQLPPRDVLGAFAQCPAFAI